MLEHGDLRLPKDFLAYLKRIPMRENAPHLFLAWLSSHPIDEESLPFVTRCFEHCVEHLTEHVQKQVKKHLTEA